MRHDLTPVRMATIKTETTTENSKCWQGCGEIGTLVHCWQECNTETTDHVSGLGGAQVLYVLAQKEFSKRQSDR